MKEKSQLLIIGAGPGGYPAAFYAADKGMKVTLIERFPTLGGVCLNVGCIPSKSLLHLAALKEEVKAAEAHGLHFGKIEIDLNQIRRFKNSVVSRMAGGLTQLSKARQVKVITGTARFTHPQGLAVDTEKGVLEMEFEHCIVAAGSRPIIPPSLSLPSGRVIDSTGALEMKDIPEHLLIIGGGIIGLEIGSVYSAFGSAVTVIEALPHLAPGVDRDIIGPLEKKFRRNFEAIHLESQVESLKEAGNRVQVIFSKGGKRETVSFDRVLVSIGRRPNSDRIAPEKANLNLDEMGFIAVNKQMQTSNPRVFAIGDITGNPMLAHKASREARVAVDAINGKKVSFDNLCIPSVIYTDPEVAWVGLTEIEARAEAIPYKLGKFPWAASGRAVGIGRSEGFTKILFDPKTERVLGMGIVGVNAGEMIAEGTLAIEMGAVMEDLAGTIHPHPTLSESVSEASEDLRGLCTHLYSPKSK